VPHECGQRNGKNSQPPLISSSTFDIPRLLATVLFAV
jgi:hypothetical protein